MQIYLNLNKNDKKCIYTMYIYSICDVSAKTSVISYGCHVYILWVSYGAGCCLEGERTHGGITKVRKRDGGRASDGE